MNIIERVTVLNVPVDIVNMDSALALADRRIRERDKGAYILAVNPEKVFALEQNPFLRQMFEKASLSIPDGIGIVLAVRLLYGKKITRVPGSEFMPNLCKMASDKGYTVFIYGAKEEVNKAAVDKLRLQYPSLQIVGRCNGYIGEDKMSELVDQISQSAADILFVALGSPKQEEWIQKYLPKVNVGICQGIGGTLDTIAGTVKRAPVAFRKMGLEWFYRLVKDPSRIRRQKVLPVFALRVLGEKIRGVK
jgi:N-acetylglucosaminyldiphosphoundecaprenol N-acetyl-beta-D-mannosaminyltransferase